MSMKRIIVTMLLFVFFATGVSYSQADTTSVSTHKTSTPKKHHKKHKKVEAYVLICNSKSAYAYHSYQCRGLSRCRSSISKVKESEARSMGYSPCKICY